MDIQANLRFKHKHLLGITWAYFCSFPGRDNHQVPATGITAFANKEF